MTNRLAKSELQAPARNPLTDPVVAREWAGWASRDGKPELARLWSDHAWTLEHPSAPRAIGDY
jgi:hypothetical protein